MKTFVSDLRPVPTWHWPAGRHRHEHPLAKRGERGQNIDGCGAVFPTPPFLVGDSNNFTHSLFVLRMGRTPFQRQNENGKTAGIADNLLLKAQLHCSTHYRTSC